MQIAKCKEIEENNIMGKIRALLKKIGAIKGTFRLYLAQKFNKQEKQYRALSFPFPILNQSVVPCLLLTVAS